jgi:glyoxylase-like metal-dependent hydrolase (beta-lactamase superfamily II)
MSKQIDVETLRHWLDARQPVTIVDVRSADDRAQWAIPDSVHVNAYEALRAGTAGPLQELELPSDRPVVTVCSAGRMSQVAADVLAARGFDTHSLSGGMKAWSAAWNVADVPLPTSSIRVIQIRRTGKGCLSYVIGSGGDAVVIDPSVSSDVYAEIAAGDGWRIRSVVETHIHADHLSRGGQIAAQTAATLVLPAQRRVSFAFVPIADGEQISFGAATLTAMSTPGHTDESMSYRLNDIAVFTGDTLFTRGVGRPDLHAEPDDARRRARALFNSLRRLDKLPSDTLVLPAHTSEPIAFDGQPIAARVSQIRTWLSEWLISEDAFVDRVTSQLPPTPPNFTRIVELNQLGDFPAGDPTELEAGANRCAVR